MTALAVVRAASEAVELEMVPGIGGRIHRLRAFGVDVLRTPDDPARHTTDPWFWGSYPMAPWCNRLPAGSSTVAGRTIDLPSNFPDGTAIHGQVATAPWTVEADVDGDLQLGIRAGGDGWPWPYVARQTIALRGATATLSLGVTNLGDTPMPAGVGFHPWFRDPVDLTIRSTAVHPSNLDPSRDPEPVSGALDRRRPGRLAIGVDATWTDLEQPPVELAWPRDGLSATWSTSPSVTHIVAAHLPEVDATAVEPETHAPGGLRRLRRGEPGALALLDPGAVLAITVRLTFARREVGKS